MTVISTLITKHCTVHCSDSFITKRESNGDYSVIESQSPKIVAVEKYRGAMSYFWLATYPAAKPEDKPEWCTLNWLEGMALKEEKPDTAWDFAVLLRDQLTKDAIKYCKAAGMGLAVHFTAYEEHDGYQIPELFYISNIDGINSRGIYEGVLDEFSVGRHSFFTMVGERVPVSPDHGKKEYRLAVKHYLDNGGMLWYNNGDPLLFNKPANALMSMAQTLSFRGMLSDHAEPVKFYGSLALEPVKVVSVVQQKMCKKGTAIVGGKCHQLIVRPTGDYDSETGLKDIPGRRIPDSVVKAV